ncbi:MAG TPA: hypothetical protein VKS21_12685, partial [Spirochaetota bacterium]|nr:hypothetical protein [Spirochaetota bacterium]
MFRIKLLVLLGILELTLFYAQNALPENVNAVYSGENTNLITWDLPATNVNYYTIYCYTNIITAANQNNAFVLSTNVNGSTNRFYHILDEYPPTQSTNSRGYFYAVCANVGTAGGGPSAKIPLDTGMVTKEAGDG